QNLLGKRVDYSGRSVIVVGPELKMYQCGVPKEMAIELFRPFVMKKLVEDGVANNIKSAKKMVDRQKPEVWDALDVVIKEHPVLLNRAPTLHRLGIQAFEPVLVEGRALKLHPLACTAYNADFDGDQMAIHVPLSAEAQAEARILMLSVNNLLRPQDGHPHSIPTQDMVLGSYYLTYVREEEGTGMAFSTPEEALMAYQAGAVTLHSPIKVRVTKTIDGVEKYKTVETTVGRIIFNEPIPQDLGFVDRTDPEHAFDYEVGFRVDKKKLGEIIDRCIQKHGFTISAEVLDSIKAQGYKFSTRSGMTISIADMVVPEAKKEKIAETEKKVLAIEKQYRRGLITNDERYRMVVAEWERTTGEVAKALMDNLDEFNPINIMATSGARGSANQIRQLAGMRGLMANTAGKTIEIPIKANFREGLSVLEYFISTRGARKGMADTALRTADSGYLTRRMVDVSQDVIIREPDCGTTEGVPATAIDSRGYAVFTLDPEDPKYDEYIHSFGENIHGRFPAKPVVDPKTGEVLFDTDHLLMSGDAKFLAAHGVASVEVRSVLSCESRCGVCARCYGMNLATGKPVNSGEAVGVIAAQSIGEPGTQLTMRTFHSGGVAGDDITQGLPRVEELFEARKPKKMAVLSEISGTLTIEEARKNMMALTVTNAEQGETRVYQVPVGAGIIVQNGDHIEQGQELTRGALSPHDVLRIRGVNDDEFGRPGVRNYLVQEVQKVYRQQGVDINNKHIEVIVRQMMRKVRIEDAGSTDLLSGSTVDVNELKDANKAIQARIDAGEEGLTLAAGTPILLGITKASLATDSWMSAASFQETTKVLTEAAIKGKVDHLVGLKENVIIGKLIPAGSGLDMYRNFEMKTDESIEDEADYVDLSELKKLTNAL
ncbi:MAG TPA: DNA-directed RNA polymerase subunit beta', partial [Clostridiales bacterium]|nr:DNA-directed RNA polymerase subunit beta' [Clostridiales bacterium]